MKGYGSKPKGDTSGYWCDSARELGLHDSHDGSGVRFFRNPMDSSPADELAIDKINQNSTSGCALVPIDEWDKCPDVVTLAFQQFEHCTFRSSDRRGKSRDRSIGYPGLVCIHCTQKRYFPLSERKLQDTLPLLTSHIANCFHAPLDVKASVCYLQHRALLQKQELPGHWKCHFIRGVWSRLHQSSEPADEAESSLIIDETVKGSDSSNVEMTSTPDEVAANENAVSADEVVDASPHHTQQNRHALLYDTDEMESHNHASAMMDMRDLIKSAALWLSERDADEEARARRRRDRAMKQK